MTLLFSICLYNYTLERFIYRFQHINEILLISQILERSFYRLFLNIYDPLNDLHKLTVINFSFVFF